MHSIEQPIKQGQVHEMAKLCLETPLPIALDEELIGVFDVTKKLELLQTINPQYVILKPSLIGGFRGSDEWIDIAKKNNIDWWITSALESNIGLNAIAQYTYEKQSKLRGRKKEGPKENKIADANNNGIPDYLERENGNDY